MVSLPDGGKISKISLFVLAQLTNVTDGRTDGHRVTAYTALMHMHRAVKWLTRGRVTISPEKANHISRNVATIIFVKYLIDSVN